MRKTLHTEDQLDNQISGDANLQVEALPFGFCEQLGVQALSPRLEP